jgi:hypothetical protein
MFTAILRAGSRVSKWAGSGVSAKILLENRPSDERY